LEENCTQLRSIPIEPTLEASAEHRRSGLHNMVEGQAASFLRFAQKVLYFGLYLLAGISSKQYVTILVYHSVDENDSFYSVTQKEFVKQIEYLSKNYHVVSLDDVLDFVISKRDLPRRSVAITFDDGYYDNYLNAYPRAKKYGFPIAIFVASGFVGKAMSLGKVPIKMLSWDELVEMSRNKVTIGAHTVGHPDLRQVDRREAEDQIEKCKADIESAIGLPVVYFAYPKGSYNRSLFELLHDKGFKVAFATGDGIVQRGDNHYSLKRVSMDASVSFIMFKARLTVAVEWYGKIERAGGHFVRKFPFLAGIASIYNEREKNPLGY